MKMLNCKAELYKYFVKKINKKKKGLQFIGTNQVSFVA